jgi:hypothetical protein
MDITALMNSCIPFEELKTIPTMTKLQIIKVDVVVMEITSSDLLVSNIELKEISTAEVALNNPLSINLYLKGISPHRDYYTLWYYRHYTGFKEYTIPSTHLVDEPHTYWSARYA